VNTVLDYLADNGPALMWGGAVLAAALIAAEWLRQVLRGDRLEPPHDAEEEERWWNAIR
jgi:hypothetical protein